MAKFEIRVTKPSGVEVIDVHTVVGAARTLCRLQNECNLNAEYYRSINYDVVVVDVEYNAVISRLYFDRLTKQYQYPHFKEVLHAKRRIRARYEIDGA